MAIYHFFRLLPQVQEHSHHPTSFEEGKINGREHDNVEKERCFISYRRLTPTKTNRESSLDVAMQGWTEQKLNRNVRKYHRIQLNTNKAKLNNRDKAQKNQSTQ